MKTKLWAIGLMILCTIFVTLGTFSLKKAADILEFSLKIFANHWIYIGVFAYLLGAFIMILALRGGELSVLYPILATAYIWIILLSVYVLGETISILQGIGIGSIVIGVGLVGVGNSNKVVKHGS